MITTRVTTAFRRLRERLPSSVRSAYLTIAALLLPLAAWAEDEEDRVALDQHSKDMQVHTLGIIVAIIALFIAFYLFRRWQTLRAGRTVEGLERYDD